MQQQVQRVTNAYTLQGWLKGTVPEENTGSVIAKQAFNYGLGYFENDYKPVGSVTPFININKGNDLYNGNIKAMLVNIPKIGEPVLHSYKYDQLNRLKEVNNFNNYNSSTNVWSSTNAHKETLSFDGNGNIQTALLNGAATNLPYENFTYNYDAVKKNRLLNIHNSVNNTTSNYEYDEIGNITKDELEGNKDMVWSIYGKLLMAKKINTGVKITYSYDASGNRISKHVGNTNEEWTVRDAGGNIMVTYIKDPGVNNGKLTTQGYEMYGSTAIGTWQKHRDVETEGADNNERVLTRGEQKIRFSNHLGNTMLVLSDIKRQVQSPENPSQIAGYEPVVLNATDYSAYGESLIGREFNSTGIKFGFNGKLNDNDLGYQDYGGRLFSSKKRSFNGIDPLFEKFPSETPYCFVGNSPIGMIDPDGKRKYVVHLQYDAKTGKYTLLKIVKSSGLKRVIRRDMHPKNNSTYEEYHDWYDYQTFKVTVVNGDPNVKYDIKIPDRTIGEKRTTTGYINNETWAKIKIGEGLSIDDGYGILFTSEGGPAIGTRKGRTEFIENIEGLMYAIGGIAGGGPKKLEIPRIEDIPEIFSKVTQIGELLHEDLNLIPPPPKVKNLSNNVELDNAFKKVGNTVYRRDGDYTVEITDTMGHGQLSDKKAKDTFPKQNEE